MKTDSEIQKDVMDELKWEPFLNASEIGVSVKNGAVTLSGTVDTYLKKAMAEKAAKRVAGVKAVAEEIEVKFNDTLFKNDTQIAEAVLNALKWHSAINEEKIKVKVEDGVVTLDGEVDWEYQRSSAVSQIENLIGVKLIINNITVKVGIVPKEIKQKIANAFHRSATVDSEKISVEVIDHKVILKGMVRSWAERNDAEKAAWLAPGVNKIDNRLEIESEILAI